MGSVRGYVRAGALLAVLPAPALAEVCDKEGPYWALPYVWIMLVVIGIALWRGGWRWIVGASLVILVFMGVAVWGHVTEDEGLRYMTESAIQEGCRLPLAAEIAVFLALAALPWLRLLRRQS